MIEAIATELGSSNAQTVIPGNLDSEGRCSFRVWTQRLIVRDPRPNGLTDIEYTRFIFSTPGEIIRASKDGKFAVEPADGSSGRVELTITPDSSGIGINPQGQKFAELKGRPEPGLTREADGQLRQGVRTVLTNLITGARYNFVSACECLTRRFVERWFPPQQQLETKPPTLPPVIRPVSPPPQIPPRTGDGSCEQTLIDIQNGAPPPPDGICYGEEVKASETETFAQQNPIRLRDEVTPIDQMAPDELDTLSPALSYIKVLSLDVPNDALSRTHAFRSMVMERKAT